MRDFKFQVKDGTELFATRWSPDGDTPVRAVVQIIHGLSEHRRRYVHFARHLVDNGFAVYAHDLRGHGETAGTLDTAGYFADENGWDKVLSDVGRLYERSASEYPGVPQFLLGHSMGSFLARDYISQYGVGLAGVVLSGTSGNPGPALGFGIWLATRMARNRGPKVQAFQIDALSFGSYNRQFRPAATKFDWLSRDEREVANYVADRYCGGVATAGLYRDMFTGIRKINRRESVEAIPVELPVLFVSGSRDPVGNNGRGVQQVARAYRRAGIRDVTVKIYTDGRHEMLHEVNKAEVYEEIRAWLAAHLI